MDTMFRMNLRLFDGGAAAGAPSGGEAGGNATGSNAGLANQTKPEKVVYGIQDEPETGAEPQAKETNANDETETKSDPVDKGKAFDREHLRRLSTNDQQAVKGLSEGEQKTLESLLLRMRDNLKEV
jgi:hypothetical protein